MERKPVLVVAVLSLDLPSATPVPWSANLFHAVCSLTPLSWQKPQMEASHGRENQVLVELLAAQESFFTLYICTGWQGTVRSLLSLVVTHKPWAGVAVTNAPVAHLAKRLCTLMSWPNSFLEYWMRCISTAIPDAQSTGLSASHRQGVLCFLWSAKEFRESTNYSINVQRPEQKGSLICYCTAVLYSGSFDKDVLYLLVSER